MIDEWARSALAFSAGYADDGVLAEAKEKVAERGDFFLIFATNEIFYNNPWGFNDDIEIVTMAEIFCAWKSEDAVDFEGIYIGDGDGVVWQVFLDEFERTLPFPAIAEDEDAFVA